MRRYDPTVSTSSDESSQVEHFESGWVVSPNKERLQMTSIVQSLRLDEGRALEVRWTFELAAATWATVDAKGWFHLVAKFRGPVASGFNPARGVRVEARLGAEHLHALREPLRQRDGRRAVGSLLLTLDDDHLLRATEAWWGLAVTTESEPGVRAGFKSRWMDVDTILPPALPISLARFSVGGLVSYLRANPEACVPEVAALWNDEASKANVEWALRAALDLGDDRARAAALAIIDAVPAAGGRALSESLKLWPRWVKNVNPVGGRPFAESLVRLGGMSADSMAKVMAEMRGQTTPAGPSPPTAPAASQPVQPVPRVVTEGRACPRCKSAEVAAVDSCFDLTQMRCGACGHQSWEDHFGLDDWHSSR